MICLYADNIILNEMKQSKDLSFSFHLSLYHLIYFHLKWDRRHTVLLKSPKLTWNSNYSVSFFQNLYNLQDLFWKIRINIE